MGLFIAKVNNPVAFLPDPATVSPQAGTPSSPKSEMEPRISRMKKERWKQSKGSGREEGFTAKTPSSPSWTVYQKSVRISIPPEAFDCGGSHPPLFGFVMEKRRYPAATHRPAKQSRP
jgi:hypothetical protein